MGLFRRKRADTGSAEARLAELRAEVTAQEAARSEAEAVFEQAALSGDRGAIDEARSAVDTATARGRELAAATRASERDVARAREERVAQKLAARQRRAAGHARRRLECAERFDDLARQLGECSAGYEAATRGVDAELRAAGLPSRKIATATHWHLRSALWFSAPGLCMGARLAPLIGGRKRSLTEASAPEVARVDALGEEENP